MYAKSLSRFVRHLVNLAFENVKKTWNLTTWGRYFRYDLQSNRGTQQIFYPILPDFGETENLQIWLELRENINLSVPAIIKIQDKKMNP